jgi:ornithine carbamoyltransferase
MFKIKSKNFLTGEELSTEEMNDLLELAVVLKTDKRNTSLKDKTIGLLFEKPSLRTRVSFTVGIQELSGNLIEMNSLNRKKESPEHTIKVLQGYVDALMVRTFEHDILDEMAQYSKIPIVNTLSDLHHPCQVLADLMTLKENFTNLNGLKLAYVGDGNNMLHSLLLMLPPLGIDVHYSCPADFQPFQGILKRAEKRAEFSGAEIRKFNTAAEAVHEVHAIYTDVWSSMGFEKTTEEDEIAHLKKFAGYQLNSHLLELANQNAVIMHCMPVNVGQEITEEMINHPQSVLFQQSENRLHVQKALMMGMI